MSVKPVNLDARVVNLSQNHYHVAARLDGHARTRGFLVRDTFGQGLYSATHTGRHARTRRGVQKPKIDSRHALARLPVRATGPTGLSQTVLPPAFSTRWRHDFSPE